MANDALERLYNSNMQEQSNYSLEEQMDSATNEEEFLEGMSDASKSALFKATEITLEDIEEDVSEEDDGIILSNPNILDTNTTEIEENVPSESKISDEIEDNSSEIEDNSSNEVLFNNKKEIKKSRKPRKPRTLVENKSTVETTTSTAEFNPIMDQLAKDVIDDLRMNKYKISRFDNSTMELVFAYMYNKF
jgi:hypothetical protein